MWNGLVWDIIVDFVIQGFVYWCGFQFGLKFGKKWIIDCFIIYWCGMCVCFVVYEEGIVIIQFDGVGIEVMFGINVGFFRQVVKGGFV